MGFVLSSTVKDLRRRLNDPLGLLLWAGMPFVMPILFFYFIGTVTSGFGGGSTGNDTLALRVSENPGFLVDRLILRLSEQDYDVVRVDTDEELAGYRRRMTVPADLTDAVLEGDQVELRFARNGDGIGGQYDEIRVGRAVYTLLADLAVLTDEEAVPNPGAFQRLDEIPRMLTLDVVPAGKRLDPPTGFEQAIPGTLVMFTLMVLLTSGATLLVIERRQGLLRRLASTPIPRSAVVAGKWGGKIALGLVQIAFALSAGTIIFGMNWGSQLPMVLVVLFAYASLTASMGVLLGSVARTEGQAVGLGVLTANVLAALGGCWWPIEITPGWMQTFSRFLPTGAAMDALHRLVSFGSPAAAALPHTIALLTAAVAVGWIAVRVFRFQ